MQNIIVLGAGMVGSCIAVDMVKNHNVTLTDINRETLKKIHKKHNALNIIQMDVTDKSTLRQIIRDYDLVINAVPGFLGHETLRTVIEEGRNVVDIAFAPEDAMGLSQLAVEKNVTAIVDCGVAPGKGCLPSRTNR